MQPSASTERGVPPGAARLEALAFGLLAIVPLGMALVNRSAQPLIVAAAIAALGARAVGREWPLVAERLRVSLGRPIGLLCLAFLLFAAVSIAWGHHVRVSLAAYGEVVLAAGSALLLHACLPRRIPGWAMKLAAIAFALGCLTVMSELATGMALRQQLGVRSYVFIFKRSVTAMLILFWPLALWLWLSGRRPVALALGLLFALAIYAAQSTAAAMGLAGGLALVAVTALSLRAASRVAALALAAAMLIAPVLGEAAIRVLPAHVVDRLHFAHADQRIDVWLSFGEVVKRRPIGGAGFGTSSRMAQEPVAAEVPQDRRVMLGAWHPHNGYLQIWAETGTVGAALAGAAMVLLGLSIGGFARPRALAAAGIVGAAAAIMLVGHGIWQGWWSAVLGVSAFWTARLISQPGDAAAAEAPLKSVART